MKQRSSTLTKGTMRETILAASAGKEEDPVPPGAPPRAPVQEPPRRPGNPDPDPNPAPIDDPRPPQPKRLTREDTRGAHLR
jgi:hypothetical protein